MKIEEQVCSLELAKKLKELSVKQESLWYWIPNYNGTGDQPEMVLAHSNQPDYQRTKFFSAFTAAELGEILPVEIVKGEKKDRKQFHIYLAKEHGDFSEEVRSFVEYQERKTDYEVEVQRCAETEADARAEMLIYLIENGLTL